MFTIGLAGVRVRVDNRYGYVRALCRNYLLPDGGADFTVSATDGDLLAERGSDNFTDDYLESVAVYRKICERLPEYGVFLLHASVVEADGKAYAFAAKSGVGKSTHTRLWLKNIPGCRVINGDKPLFRVEPDGGVTAFGTPWNGKENWGENVSAPLAAICFLERGSENAIRPLPADDALPRLLQQFYLRGSRASVDRQLALMNPLIASVPFYLLSCTISDEAAILAYQTMKND